MARVYPTPAARADLLDIREFSIDRFGPDVADGYFLGFDEAFDLLANHPLVGEARPELGKDIRCLVHRRHRIFYTVRADMVLIVRIVHHAKGRSRMTSFPLLTKNRHPELVSGPISRSFPEHEWC